MWLLYENSYIIHDIKAFTALFIFGGDKARGRCNNNPDV